MSGGGGHGRRGHEEEHEEHENHERWLVSYADMMTLLMVLFIVLFAISQVDQKKFAALKTGLAAGFGAPVEIMPGADSLLSSGSSVAPDSVNLSGAAGNTSTTTSTTQQNSSPVSPATVAQIAKATQNAQVKGEVNNLKKAQQELEKALQKAGLKKAANFRFNERGLVVTIATDNVLFQSGSSTLEAQGRRILKVLGPTLRALPNHLSIDGHTNSIPIHTARFASNWELSADRATGVLRYLHSADQIGWGRMSATAYADTMPRLPASNPKSVASNRRVEIIVLAQVDNSAGRAVETLGNGDDTTSSGTSAPDTSATKSTTEKH